MKKVRYTYKQYQRDVKLLIRRIKYAKFKPKTIIGIATGGLPLGTKLKNKLKVPLLVISAISYSGQQKGNLVFNASFTKPIQSPVLIVDDICDTGQTMSSIYNYITSLGIEAKTATLFYKDKSIFKPNWFLNKVENHYWVYFEPWE